MALCKSFGFQGAVFATVHSHCHCLLPTPVSASIRVLFLSPSVGLWVRPQVGPIYFK